MKRTKLQSTRRYGERIARKRLDRQAWLLYILSRALLPELHQIIRFYRTTDFGGNAARRNDLLEAFETPPTLQPFADFLAETRWADAERTYKDLAAPE